MQTEVSPPTPYSHSSTPISLALAYAHSTSVTLKMRGGPGVLTYLRVLRHMFNRRWLL